MIFRPPANQLQTTSCFCFREQISKIWFVCRSSQNFAAFEHPAWICREVHFTSRNGVADLLQCYRFIWLTLLFRFTSLIYFCDYSTNLHPRWCLFLIMLIWMTQTTSYFHQLSGCAISCQHVQSLMAGLCRRNSTLRVANDSQIFSNLAMQQPNLWFNSSCIFWKTIHRVP